MVSNLRMGAWLLSVHAWFLRTQTRVCVRMSLVRNAILTPVSFVSYPNAILTPFFHPFIEFAPFLGREAPTVWRHGIRSLLQKQRPIFVQQASSWLSIYYYRGLPVPLYCRLWLRGGGILPTSSSMLIGKWLWLSMTSTTWPALGAMGLS